MNLNPQQIAESLARKCAANIHSRFSDEWFANINPDFMKGASGEVYTEEYRIASEKRKTIVLWIQQSIPLVELLELINVAEQSLIYLEVLDMFPEQLTLRNKCINITTKLKQLGVTE